MANFAALNTNVELARKGDQTAFGAIVASTQNLVSSVALAIVHDVRASEDIAQEAYVQTWQKLDQLKRNQSFLPWLRQITRHCAYQWLEREKHNHQSRQESLEPEFESLVDDSLPDEKLNQAQREKILAAAMAKLPDESRDIVVLYYREQQSAEHVAKLLDLEPATVRQRLSRARKTLAEDLLKRVGKAALLTAPSLSATAILSSVAMFAAPPAAAATGTAVTTSLTGFGKWFMLLGTAAVGLFGGLAGIFIGAKQAQKYANNDAAQATITKIRNQTAWFFMIIGGLFFASYELDDSWVMPTITYCILIVGVMLNQSRVHQHIHMPKNKKWQCYAGAIGGLGGGFSGLIGGFLLSGRL